MSFFGGSGSGKGWLTLRAVPTPQLLASALSGADLRFFRSRATVGESLQITRDEVVDLYAKRLASLLHGPTPGTWKRILIATPDVPMEIRDTTPGTHTTLSPQRPGIWLREQRLEFTPPDRLSATVLSSKAPAFGLAFEFPRVASFSGEGHVIRHEMTRSPSGIAFARIEEEIRASTKPLVVAGPHREWRLPIRVSPELKPHLSQHPLLVQNGLRIR